MESDPSPSREPVAGAAPPANVNALWARVLVDEFARLGLTHVVIAPGSRSAPLVFEFAAHPDIDDISVIDERSAGFVALGMARALDGAVALLCTSGTAAANFLPAVCEADADDVPMLVLTADRPPEDHDCGAPQTMDQVRLYGSRVRWFHDLSQPEADAHKLSYLRALACRAWSATRSPAPGPVHLNARFRKPLEPIEPGIESDAGDRDRVPSPWTDSDPPSVVGRPRNAPWLRVEVADRTPSERQLEQLAERVRTSRRPLVVAGAERSAGRYRDALRDFAVAAAVPVVAEATSNLRHWRRRGESVIGAGELLAARGVFDRLRPDLLIHVGRAPVTWGLQRTIASLDDVPQIRVADDAPAGRIVDPDHRLCEQLVADPGPVFERLSRRCAERSDRRRTWVSDLIDSQRRQLDDMVRMLSEAGPLSAPRFWHELGALLPSGCALHCSSSMLVRHLETFLCAHADSLEVYFNRGLNGIDGVLSTAAGIARARRRGHRADTPTVVVIGDVAFRHDVAALLLAVEMELDLTVIVVDNDGGEIFDYLPSARFEAIHETHFATSNRTPLADIVPTAVAMDQPSDWPELRASVRRSLSAPGLHLIRVSTDRRRDVGLRRALLAAER